MIPLQSWSLIVFILAWILVVIALVHLTKIFQKLTRVKSVKQLKGRKDFMTKSSFGSDLILDVLFSQKYSKRFHKEVTIIRITLIPGGILVIVFVLLWLLQLVN